MTGIDLNRAGTPLLEIVSEPDMRSAEEAVAYAKTLHALVRWIDICDGNMQEGSFRCDANVSVRPAGSDKLGTRCEIKNLNSFRFMEQAIEFEVRRQIELIEDGGKVVQETRLYDPDKDETRPMRSKEDAMDYRYFPDPDLLPLEVNQEWIEDVEAGTARNCRRRSAVRYIHEYELSGLRCDIADSIPKTWRDYFEDVLVKGTESSRSKTGGELDHWRSLMQRSIERNIVIAAKPVDAATAAGLLIGRIADGTLSDKIAKGSF